MSADPNNNANSCENCQAVRALILLSDGAPVLHCMNLESDHCGHIFTVWHPACDKIQPTIPVHVERRFLEYRFIRVVTDPDGTLHYEVADATDGPWRRNTELVRMRVTVQQGYAYLVCHNPDAERGYSRLKIKVNGEPVEMDRK